MFAKFLKHSLLFTMVIFMVVLVIQLKSLNLCFGETYKADDKAVISPVYYKDKPVNHMSKKKVVAVFVDKSARKMFLLDETDHVVKYYHIALGDSPKGHKQQEGDEKTPEGSYILDYKNENSIAYRSIHISYPNQQDQAVAKKLGVNPGGAIMIHGQMNGLEHLTKINQQRDWTDGCIAVTNDEMDEIMDLVDVGTKIQIEW